MRTLPFALAVLAVALGLSCVSVPASPAVPPSPPVQQPPAAKPHGFDRVFIVILENEDFTHTSSQPFIAELMKRSAVLTSYRSIGNPSQPNYLAIISGSSWGLTTALGDRAVTLDGRHIGDLLEAKGRTWKVYAEGYPGQCFLGEKKGGYVRRHVPFLSFANVQKNPARCSKIVNAKQLDFDIAAGKLPTFALYIPDNENNGHNTGIAYADKWLKARFGPLLDDPKFMRRTLFVLTFDEGHRRTKNQIATLLYGDAVMPGQYGAPFNHYDLLRTIEDAFDLGTLDREDSKARDISGMWRQ